MAFRHKILYSVNPDGLIKDNTQVQLKVFGIFDTYKVIWKYYTVSVISIGNLYQFTDDICSKNYACTIESIESYAKKFDDIEGAKKYVDDFKLKWETGSNNTIQEVRDQKLKELTDEK